MNGGLVVRATRALLERTARTTGDEFFRALSRGLADTLGTRFAYVGELLPDGATIQTHGLWTGDGFADDVCYPLAGSPCERVVKGDVWHHPRGVARLFPDSAALAQLGIESFFGLPLVAASGDGLGLLVAMHDAPTEPLGELVQVLELFADRAAAELERRRSEAARNRSETRYRAIIDCCLEGVWTVDTAGVTTFVNPQLAAMFGYTVDEMLGRPMYDFMDDEGRAIARGNLARRADGIAEQHDFRFRHRTGREVWTRMSTSPMYDEDGAYVGALAMAIDITEQRALSARIEQAQRLDSLGVLAGGVAHDFNNLLAGMLGHLDVARRAGGDGGRLEAALDAVRTGALRASELTRQLLAFAGKSRLDLTRLDLDALIADLSRVLATAVPPSIELRVEPAGEPTTLDGDPGQLGQVVMNLIINAREAIGERPGAIAVTTRTLRADGELLRRRFPDANLTAGDYVVLEVTDDGVGMDAATQARLFEPFFTTKFAGRGLGMAAVLGILRGHRGAIRVDSEPGRGTRFEVLLPRAGRAVTAPIAVVPPPEVGDDAGDRNRTILLVDDEPSIRAAAAMLLADAGYATLEAVDGPDAIARFRDRADQIDLVILDLTMPGPTGEQVLRQLRAIRASVRVLLSSGYSAEHAVVRQAGAAGFLAKPWTADALLEAVRRELAR